MDDFKTLTEQIQALMDRIETLENKVIDTSTNVEEKDTTPYSIGNVDKTPLRIADILTGSDGNILWNDSELKIPPFGQKPPAPQKGYNKHFHTRYAGGALDINSLEIVEYDVQWEIDDTISKHSQQFWAYEPRLKQIQNTKNENVDKIGLMALVFDPDSVQWGASAFEIDIEKCYFVQKNPDGTIKLDTNGKEMKAKIFNTDNSKTSIIWDKDNQCWRFYAVFAEL